MNHLQQTVAKEVACEGVALHSGKRATLKIKPAPVNHGIKFVRVDLPNHPSVAAQFNKVVDTSQATVIGEDGFIVSTIEHLMASFAGLQIDNAIVEVDDYELPFLDGSSGPFVQLIKSAGVTTQSAPRLFFMVRKPVEIKDDEKFVGVYPAPDFRITFTIEYPKCALIGTQTYDSIITPDRFEKDIANARTFGFVEEVEYLKMYGLAKAASLDNAVVIDSTGKNVLNQDGLRFDDEFVRHKVLDSIGDFSLIGLPIIGHVVAIRSGHGFNHAFLEEFFKHKDAWQTKALAPPLGPHATPFKQLAN